ncbi:hypothetical protein Bbelb_234610 [Branchiostoma belcheri]|nr:hypothetical protein Bbelb_234610 [Branchiostoma belcheri]
MGDISSFIQTTVRRRITARTNRREAAARFCQSLRLGGRLIGILVTSGDDVPTHTLRGAWRVAGVFSPALPLEGDGCVASALRSGPQIALTSGSGRSPSPPVTEVAPESIRADVGEGRPGPQIPRITTGLHAASLALVLACAPIASAIVLVILFRKPQLLTISNRFVCNLLVVDLFQALLVVPFALVSTIAQDWIFADAFCKVTAILLHLFLHVAVITVVIISVDRYLAILHPLSYNDRMTPNTSMYLIGFAWVLGAVQSTPPLYKVGSFGFDPDQLTCTVLWTNTNSFPYAIYHSLAAFWCPLVIMGLGYWQVFLAARKQHKLIYPSVKRRTLHKGIVEAAVSCAVLPGPPAHNPSLATARSRSLDDLRRPRRTFRMASRRIKRMQKDCKAAKIVFIVMATHLLSIGPHTALVLVKATSPDIPVPAYAGALVICLYFLQTCLHPCVYAYVHRSIRREVALLLCRSHSAQAHPRTLLN